MGVEEEEAVEEEEVEEEEAEEEEEEGEEEAGCSASRACARVLGPVGGFVPR